jgi:hypothetical protein
VLDCLYFLLTILFLVILVHFVQLEAVGDEELDRQSHELREHHLEAHVEQLVLISFQDEDARLEYGFPPVLNLIKFKN